MKMIPAYGLPSSLASPLPFFSVSLSRLLLLLLLITVLLLRSREQGVSREEEGGASAASGVEGFHERKSGVGVASTCITFGEAFASSSHVHHRHSRGSKVAVISYQTPDIYDPIIYLVSAVCRTRPTTHSKTAQEQQH